MKNLQGRHGQCGSILFHETFSLGKSNLLLDLPLGDNRVLLTGPESIHKVVREMHALLHVLVRASNKQQRRSRIISNFKKGETFFIFYKTKRSWGYSHDAAPPSFTLQKRLLSSPSSPLQFGKKENIPGHSFERRTYRFLLKATRVFLISTGRVERGW